MSTSITLNSHRTMVNLARPNVISVRSAVAGPRASFAGALVTKAVDQTAADYSTATAVAWDTETDDTGGFHEGATHPDRLTIPSGISRARVTAAVSLASVTAGTMASLALYKNGSFAYSGAVRSRATIDATQASLQVVSPALAVEPGDYFQAIVQCDTDASVTVVALESWMALEVVA